MAGMPDFLSQMLQAQYGDTLTQEILDGYTARRPVTLRINTLKTTPDALRAQLTASGISYTDVPWSETALMLPQARERELEALPLYAQGEIYLQSLSSMLPPLYLQPQPGDNVLDMAAAPGGKTTQLAAMTQESAMITACEKNAVRAQRLRFNLERQGAGRVAVLEQDARKLDDFFSFDKILLDAPCSGSGTLQVRDGELVSKFSRALVDNSARLQKELLRKALRLLRPGCEMVYSTCSILRQENEDVLRSALKSGQAELVPLTPFPDLPLLPVQLPGALCVAPGPLYEGFFVARLRKRKG